MLGMCPLSLLGGLDPSSVPYVPGVLSPDVLAASCRSPIRFEWPSLGSNVSVLGPVSDCPSTSISSLSPISRLRSRNSSSVTVFQLHLACFLVQPEHAVRCLTHSTRNLRHRSQGGVIISPLPSWSVRCVMSDRNVASRLSTAGWTVVSAVWLYRGPYV